MAFENKPGQGALFVNEKTKDSQPDRRGEVVCPCCKAELQIAGWLKKSKAGNQYLSLKLQQKTSGEAPRPAAPQDDEFSDEIPF